MVSLNRACIWEQTEKFGVGLKELVGVYASVTRCSGCSEGHSELQIREDF